MHSLCFAVGFPCATEGPSFVLLLQRLRRQHLLALPCAVFLATDVLDLWGEQLEVMWEAQT